MNWFNKGLQLAGARRFSFMSQQRVAFPAIILICAAHVAAVEATVQVFAGEASAPEQPLSLWYRRPAAQWVEALAFGNGRLGGMIYGRIENERIQLNENTLWAAGPYDPSNTNALAALPEARRLVFAGQYQEAEKFIHENMMSKPLREMPYQTLGDLVLNFPETRNIENYRRELNLDTAIARVTYAADGVTFNREIFASAADNVIVMRLSASKPGQISFQCSLNSPQTNQI